MPPPATIREITPPAELLIAASLPGAYFHDSYVIPYPVGKQSALAIYLQVIGASPPWVHGLMRANGVPTGLCYQRLTVDEIGPPFCLHGLNAVWLAEHGWYRLDARGNKPGVDAAFTPPVEQLAFAIRQPGEADLPEIWDEPLPLIVAALHSGRTVAALLDNFPDIPLIAR